MAELVLYRESTPEVLVESLIEDYREERYGIERAIEPLLEANNLEPIALIFNQVERLRQESETLMSVSSWLIADLLKALYDYYKRLHPDWNTTTIIEALYNFVNADTFRSYSENTIFQYIRVAEQFPPHARKGLSFTLCFDSVIGRRYAEKIASSEASSTISDEKFLEIVRDVNERGGSRKELSEQLLRRLSGIGYPFLLMDGINHRVVLAIDASPQALQTLPLMGSFTARELSKSLLKWLKAAAPDHPIPLEFKFALGNEQYHLKGHLKLDDRAQFPLIVVQEVEVSYDGEVVSDA
ncbi:MAG: hypothetical protein QXT58_05120 [Archaeoglobaceae archaeon]